jgi:hypothetical protein
MNMILHDFATANIVSGNTLAAPKFKDGEQLRTYDYVVANPPFSDKTWTTGITPSTDSFRRFAWGEPPAKQGDYAYLLHIVRSMKGAGKAACILPHGVLFRAAMPRPRSGSNLSAPVISRASSAYPPTSFTAPAFPPASSRSTRRTRPAARACL